MKTSTRIVYPHARRVGLAESSRLLLLHILQSEYGLEDGEQTETDAIEHERRYLRDRIGRKPGTALILEHMLMGLYEDAREQLRQQVDNLKQLPPPGCPYTLDKLLGTPAFSTAT